jgi:surface antigen
MNTKVVGAMALTATVALGGCASTGPTQEQAGMVIGGILGGIGGNQIGRGSGRTAAIIIGTLAGAAIGGSVGRSMDETDRLKTAHSLETVRTGVPSTWQNPDTGNSYTVTPTRTYESSEGPCREYSMDAYVGNKREQVYGTACRQADGSWKTQN